MKCINKKVPNNQGDFRNISEHSQYDYVLSEPFLRRVYIIILR